MNSYKLQKKIIITEQQQFNNCITKRSLSALGIQELPLLAGNQTMSPHTEGTGKQEPITLIKKM